MAADHALGRQLRAGDVSVIDELVRRGDRDSLRLGLESEYDVVRESALSGLAQLRDPRDLPTMLELMDDDYIADVAQLCVQDYGAAAVQPLLDKLAAGTDDLPVGIVEALGAIGDARAVPALRELAAAHPAETVRDWAREAIERIEAG